LNIDGAAFAPCLSHTVPSYPEQASPLPPVVTKTFQPLLFGVPDVGEFGPTVEFAWLPWRKKPEAAVRSGSGSSGK
jgi:hypothetical protein